MSSIICKCGNRIGFGEIPNPKEWLTVSDVEYDGYSALIDAEVLYATMKHILACDQCERLWIFWNGFQSMPTCYSKDN
jgi:hypothetical protein